MSSERMRRMHVAHVVSVRLWLEKSNTGNAMLLRRIDDRIDGLHARGNVLELLRNREQRWQSAIQTVSRLSLALLVVVLHGQCVRQNRKAGQLLSGVLDALVDVHGRQSERIHRGRADLNR